MPAEALKGTLTNYGPCDVAAATTLDPIVADVLRVLEKHQVILYEKDSAEKLVAVGVKKGRYLEALVMACDESAQGVVSAISAYFGFATFTADEMERLTKRTDEHGVAAIAERIARKLDAAAVIFVGEPVEAQ